MPKHANPAPFRCSMSMEDTTATITMEGEIGFEASPIAFCDQVDAAVAAGATALIIRINSPGGICYDGLAMGEKLRTCGLPTTGIVIGSAMSMAGYLLQCCDKRIALATSTIMVHQPSAGLFGPVDELLSAAQYFVRMRGAMFALMGERCGMSGADFSALHASMKFYTAAEALALGLVDEITGSEADAEPAAAPEPEQPASALGTPMPCAGAHVRMLDPRHMAAAFTMAADEEEEPSTEETAEEAAEEAAEEQAEEPAEDPTAEEVSEAEEEEAPAEVPEPAPVPAPEKEPQAYITREEHLAAMQQQEARIFARLGVPAASLPAPVATEGGHMPTPA
ncbi:MAG: ATP-dependent Clp protease proteolytic subunit, partial [Clostridia bacterium]|nr:ATP-dependent Clp protease proteolytic subunit [Clostridia bacterium]